MHKKFLLFATLFTILALVLSILSTGCVAKKSPETPTATASTPTITSLDSRVSSLESTLANVQTKVNVIPPDHSDDIDTLQSDNETITSQVTAIEAEITSLEDTIVSLNERIADLEDLLEEQAEEEEDIADTDPEDAVEVEAKYFPTFTASNDKTQVSIPVKLKLTNTLPVKIQDVYIDVNVRITSDLDITKMELVGSSITWQGSISESRGYFSSWDEIKLGANERDTLTLSLVITYDNTLMEGPVELTIGISSECEDYEIV